MKALVVIDDWKLGIYAKHLDADGYRYSGFTPSITPGCLASHVEYEFAGRLQRVLEAAEKECKAMKEKPKTCLADGSEPTPGYEEIRENGQQNGYLVLSEEERAKGFLRPLRYSYIHGKCGGLTTMSTPVAETYARDPSFFTGTFCCHCCGHFPLPEFTWDGDGSVVGP
ncbi:MAG: hypothetical protein COX57_05820 [Alphaproteobacteria bacterium CG_4_10_14_0_2_um_filter_63_37]|nr:MAG: hypothetical protein COX57_05820 [Alphaproteobacteria bacterium CG_4_10_14_0_2_um_filter_63_37]